jgi:hypothetical protein
MPIYVVSIISKEYKRYLSPSAGCSKRSIAADWIKTLGISSKDFLFIYLSLVFVKARRDYVGHTHQGKPLRPSRRELSTKGK